MDGRLLQVVGSSVHRGAAWSAGSQCRLDGSHMRIRTHVLDGFCLHGFVLVSSIPTIARQIIVLKIPTESV